MDKGFGRCGTNILLAVALVGLAGHPADHRRRRGPFLLPGSLRGVGGQDVGFHPVPHMRRRPHAGHSGPGRARWRRRRRRRRRHASTSRLGARRAHERRGHAGVGPLAGLRGHGMGMWPGNPGGWNSRWHRPSRHNLVERPHLHRDGPVGLDHLLPHCRENDLAVGSDQVVVALLDIGPNDVDALEGFLDQLLHALRDPTTVSKSKSSPNQSSSDSSIHPAAAHVYVPTGWGGGCLHSPPKSGTERRGS